MKLERIEIGGCDFEWCIFNAQKSRVQISLKKMKCLYDLEAKIFGKMMSFRLRPR